MMFSGNFAGAASQQLDTSLQAWRQLWLADQKMQKDEELARSQQEFDKMRLDQERELNEAATKAADQRSLQEIQARQSSELFQAFKGLPTWQQLQQASTFKDTPYEAYANNVVAQGMFDNPADANNFLQQYVASADAVGSIANLQWVEQAARSSAAQLGLDEKGLNDYVKYWTDLAQKNSEGAEQIRDATYESRMAQLKTSQANLDATVASTAQSNQAIEESKARVAEMVRQGANDQELQPYRVQQIQATLRDMDQTFNFNEAFNPERIKQLQLNNDGTLISNETASAIQQSVVDKAKADAEAAGANATIAGAQASIAYAMAGLDVARAEKNNALLDQNILLVGKQIDQIDADIASGKIRDQIAIDGAMEAKVSLVTQLASKGFGDLAEQMSNKYLKDLVGEEGLTALNQQLKDISTRTNDEAEALAQANIATSYWTTKYAEESAELEMRQRRATVATNEVNAEWAERERQQNYDLNERGMRVSEGNLALQQSNASRAATAAANASGMAPDKILKSISDITGYDQKAINNLRTGYDTLFGDISEQNRLAKDAINGDASALAQLRTILGQPNLKVADLQAQLPSLQQKWQGQLEAAGAGAIRAMAAYINTAAAFGVPITPDLFGVSGNDTLYNQALRTNPAFVELPEDVAPEKADVVAQVVSDVNASAINSSADELAVGGAAALFDSLTEKYGEDALTAMNLTSPTQLYDYMVPQNQEFQQKIGATQNPLAQMGYDLYSADSRQRAGQDLARKLQSGDSLVNALGGIGNLSESEFNNIMQASKQWLKDNGRSLTLSEEVMYGPGDYINAMNDVMKSYGILMDNLNWLSPRLLTQGK